jgi:uncharacterized glyoxalase superfamily protein PhnB
MELSDARHVQGHAWRVRERETRQRTRDHSYFAYWNVDDVDGFCSEIFDRGALVTSAPTNKPWGLQEFSVRTPDGHRITCGELIQARRQ